MVEDGMPEKVLDLIQNKDFFSLKKLLSDMHSADVVDLMKELDDKDMVIAFRLLPKDMAVDVFAYITADEKKSIVSGITDKSLQHIVEELRFDDKIDFLEEMPSNVVKKILQQSTDEERALINQFLDYPENSAGSLMTIEYVSLKKEMSVSEAMEYIKKNGIDKETIYTCYVKNNQKHLEGILSLRKLVLADYDNKISDIMEMDIVFVNTHDDQEKVASVFKKYDLIAVPVVDKEGRMIGIITIDDIVDVIEQENTEDFQKMAALLPNEDAYLSTGIFKLAKKRFLWLLILMVSATFTGIIIRAYESALQSAVILAAFIPMLMDTAGNAGSQSATLIIRSMALGEVEIRDFMRVLWIEVRVAFIVGVLLVGVNFVRVMFFDGVGLGVGITVSVSLFFTILIAKIVGCLLPIVARKLRFDPAIMASPMITTIVDTLALIVYFSLAKVILHL